ncbi:MAG: type I restriction endonuclease subunit R [Chloroflexota bacterium]
MAPLGVEKTVVQKPLLRYAEEAGWAYLPPNEAVRLRRGEQGVLLFDVLVDRLQRLNPGVVDVQRARDVADRLSRVPPTIEGNFQTWEFLKGLRTVFVAQQKRERNIRLLDPVNVEANLFQVTDEFAFTNGTHRIRADIVFLVNGVPVIVAETKSATHLEGIAEALDQIRRYHQQGPELLALLQLHTLTHLVQFYYGATWTLSRKSLFNWRDEAAGGETTNFETLVKTFIARQRVLRVLTDFILFTRTDGELSKAVLRPHQMRAVERVLSRARDDEKRRGLVWHTQGSGKTYTMITVAKKLIEEPAFQNPTVLMLVDRNELEAQLYGNLEAVGFGQVSVAESKADLQRLLRADQRGLILSMIHKFDGIPADLNKRTNIFVLVDEAHRTTGGDLGNYLMGALPNATYVGFTGTPIDRTAHGKGTFKVFGAEDPKGYLDKYSIRESIADGTTVPLHYTLAPNDLLVDRETLQREFLSLAELEGVSEVEEINRVLERAVTLQNMLKNRDRVARVAAFATQHFRENIEPMGYKAFFVAVDRESCTFYKEELDKHLPPEYSAVVISPGFNDPPHLAKHHLSEDAEQRIRKAFRKPNELPKILIVTEKLLTGFDAPILYGMYLDKPMRDHVLLQAIARVNRPYEDAEGRRKPAGFVLDFVGIFEKLEAALAFDSADVSGVIEGLDVLRQRFEQLMTTGRSDYLPLRRGLVGDKAVEAVLEHFRDQEMRDTFYQFFRELEEVYEILSPDAFLRPFLKDYEELTAMYRLVRAAFEPNTPVDKSFQRKTAELVQQYTRTGDLLPPQKVWELNADTLEQIANSEQPDTVKVFNLLKALHDLVEQQGKLSPYLISIGERAQQIAEAFKERQKATEEALRELEALLREFREAEESRSEKDLSPEAFAVFWMLKRDGVPKAEEVGRELGSAFEHHPHWQTSADQEREVRIATYKALIDAGVEKMAEVADRLLSVLRRAAS